MTTKHQESIRAGFNSIIAEIATLPKTQQEEALLNSLDGWMKGWGDEEVKYVIYLLDDELGFYRGHPTIVACQEMIEGMLALREIRKDIYNWLI